MPPGSPHSQHNERLEDVSPLTDQNVAILYQIIQAAETNANVRTQPFHAIFAAYDNILPQNGVDPAHDQVYLRFLFKLGDRRDEGLSLFESFEKLLEELGIHIEFNTEEVGLQEVTRNLGDYEGDQRSTYGVKDGSRRSRRASLNSIYDAEDESTRIIRRRARSRSSIPTPPKIQDQVLHGRPSTRATSRPAEKVSTNVIPSRKAFAPTRRSRLSAQGFTNELKYRGRSRSSITSEDVERYHNTMRPEAAHDPASVHSRTSTDDLSSTPSILRAPIHNQAWGIQHGRLQPYPDRKVFLSSPSRTQLLRDADTFQQYRVQSVAREIVDRWCDAALEAKNHHESFRRIAVARDTETLLQQAYEHWRIRLHAKKQIEETERYFDHLERRAAKARDLYLLTKAFYHWAKSADDEVLRNSLARHQILSLKYFHAWRDITFSTQNKIQHHSLSKFFAAWQNQHAREVAHDINADLQYRQTLVRSGYWRWFWAFCERRAPEWHSGRLKHKMFLRWVAAHRRIVRRRLQVDTQVDRNAKTKILARWLGKATGHLTGQKEAANFNNRQITSRTWHAWTLSCRLAGPARQVSNMVDWRVASAGFATFVNNSRIEKQAANVHRLRIIRSAWTQWNDCLRWRTLAHRLDDRCVLETLYKWAVAERYVLFRRLSQQRLKQRLLHRVHQQSLDRQTRRASALLVLENRNDRSTMHLILMQLLVKTRFQRQAEHMAFEFHTPKVVHESLHLWAKSSRHVQMLDRWASKANFYFLTKRFLRHWQTATAESKRNKRRTAYVQTRRRMKENSAFKTLTQWRNVSSRMYESHQRAFAVNETRLLRFATDLFDHWKQESEIVLDQGDATNDRYDRQIAQRCLNRWKDRIGRQIELEETAVLEAGLRVKKTSLRKLRLRIIELRGQDAKSRNLLDNHQKRHFRNFLGHWDALTLAKQNRPQLDRMSPLRGRGTQMQVEEDDRLGITTRAEDWTDFDVGEWIPGAEAQSSTSPFPGYLSTPSKRAARAKALVRESTTPAGTPLQNRLGSQLNATPRMTRRSVFGKSSHLRGNVFGAIMEDSPSTPGPGRER